MRIGIYSVAAATSAVMNVKTSAKSLNLQVEFRGPELVDTILHAESEDVVLDALRAALNGNISISYSTPHGGDGETLINNRPLADVMEIYSAMGGTLTIKHVAQITVGAEDFSRYRASFNIPLSHTGSVMLGENASLDVQFSGFTNAVIAGLATAKCDAIITVDTLATPYVATDLIVMESIGSTVGTTSALNVGGRNIIALPADLAKVLLISRNGTLEFDENSLDGFVESNTEPHILCCGLLDFYYKWIVLSLDGYTHGTVELGSSNKYYTFYSKML